MTADRHTEDEADRALDDPALAELFSALRAQGSRPAPPVGPQLGLLLRTGAAPRPRRRGARGATVGLVVVGVVAGGVGAAAAAGHLPLPLRSVTDGGERHAPRPAVGDDDTTAPTTLPPPIPVSVGPDPADPAEPASREPDADADPVVDGGSDEGTSSEHDGRPVASGSSSTPRDDGDDDDEGEAAESGSPDRDTDSDSDGGSTQADEDGDGDDDPSGDSDDDSDARHDGDSDDGSSGDDPDRDD